MTGYNFKFKATEDGEITLPIGVDGIYGWKTNVTARWKSWWITSRQAMRSPSNRSIR